MESPLIIRSSIGKRLWLALGGLAFSATGYWMMQGSRATSGKWSTDFGYAMQPVVGVAAILFGLAALAACVYICTHPAPPGAAEDAIAGLYQRVGEKNYNVLVVGPHAATVTVYLQVFNT